MGGDAMYRVIQRTRATGAARHVVLALASFADGEGWCYPSIRQLARRAGVDPMSVQRALPVLTQLGELEVHLRGRQRDPIKDRGTRPGGFQSTHYYRLLFAVAPSRVATSAGVRTLRTPQESAGVRTLRTEVCASSAGVPNISKRVTTSHLKAGRSAPAVPVDAVENPNAPTEPQLRKLTYAVGIDEGFADRSSLVEAVKAKAAQLPGFDYTADLPRLHRAVDAVLDQVQGKKRRGKR